MESSVLEHDWRHALDVADEAVELAGRAHALPPPECRLRRRSIAEERAWLNLARLPELDPESVEARSAISAEPDVVLEAPTHTRAVSHIEPETCSLRLAAEGVVESCPRDRCGFWEPGNGPLPGGCVLSHLGVDFARPDLAAYLLEVRTQLEQAGNLAAAERAHREFSRRIGREL
jgi:hypothetical protein